MMRLVQQIVLLLRIGAAPDTVQEYTGDTPVKVMNPLDVLAGHFLKCSGDDGLAQEAVQHFRIVDVLTWTRSSSRSSTTTTPA